MMRILCHAAVLAITSLYITTVAFADTLTCNVVLLTAPGGYPHKEYSASNSADPFFAFRIDRSVDSEVLHEQVNRCINRRTIGDRWLNGSLCLLVTSGPRRAPIFGSASVNDTYQLTKSPALTFSVYQMQQVDALTQRVFINQDIEMAGDTSSVRFSIQQGRNGLGSLTVTCQ